MAAMDWINNIYIWMGGTFLFLILFLILFIIIILLAKKTHAIIELKAWRSGTPICQFYEDSGYVQWKSLKPEAGIIQDKHYGTYIVNEMGTYIDRTTKNIMIPFDASFASSVNIKAAKLADDLQYIIKDRQQLAMLREAVLKNQLEDAPALNTLRTSIQISAIKSMMTAMIPHNITAKIEKAIASKLKGFGKVDGMQVLIIFAGILGAIIMGYILIKSVGGG